MEALQLQADGEASLALSFRVPPHLSNFPAGLDSVVEYQHQYQQEDNWTRLNTPHWRPNTSGRSQSFTAQLANLTLAWTNFTVRVRLQSAAADSSDPRYRGETAAVRGLTAARAPDLSPSSCRACWEGGDRPHSLLLYWQSLPPVQHNGPGFHYRARNARGDKPVRTTAAFAEFHSVAAAPQIFTVASVNQLGAADGTVVEVAGQAAARALRPSSVTATQRSDGPGQWLLSWARPTASVTSYTVFWCASPAQRPVQCEGRLEWEEVEGDELRHSLTLPSQHFQLAVAAHSDSGSSSGLVWADCTVVAGRVVSSVAGLRVEPGAGPAELLVRWTQPCGARGGVVLGYTVQWCEGSQCSNATTAETETRLTGLAAWTEYNVTVTVRTENHPSQPSRAVLARTRPAAPASPPTNLMVTPTNISAQLVWQLPVQPNGPVPTYQLTLREEGTAGIRHIFDANSTTFLLSNLQPFSRYSVAVAGCNLLGTTLDCQVWFDYYVTQNLAFSSAGPRCSRCISDVAWTTRTAAAPHRHLPQLQHSQRRLGLQQVQLRRGRGGALGAGRQSRRARLGRGGGGDRGQAACGQGEPLLHTE